LARFLELEGWSLKENKVPLLAIPRDGAAGVDIGTYPALLEKEAAKNRHFVAGTGSNVVLLPDYLVEQDLPSAYQEVLRHAWQHAVGGAPGQR